MPRRTRRSASGAANSPESPHAPRPPTPLRAAAVAADPSSPLRGRRSRRSRRRTRRRHRGTSPTCVVRESAAAVSGEPSSNGCQRSGGTSPTEHCPSHRNCQSSSGPVMPPGNRQPRPIDGDRLVDRVPGGGRRGRVVVRVRIPCRSEELDHGIDGRVLPEVHRRDRPAQQSASSPESSTASRDPTPTSFSDASRSISSASHPSRMGSD